MLVDFFGGIVKNINMGLTGAFTALTTSPLHQGEAPQGKLVSEDLVAKALAGIPSAVDPKITKAFSDAEREKMKLFSNLIADPYAYKNLSRTDKILVTRIVIEDLIGLHKPDQTNKDKDPINSIISRISVPGNNSFINESDAIVISNYYVGLDKATEKQIPVETPPNFQCQRGGDPRNGRAGGGDTQGRRSQNAFAPPPALFPDSKGKENRTPAQLQRSAEMRNEMQRHIESERRNGSIHPAGNKPINNNITKSPSNQGLRTGRDAMNYVFKQGGVTTNHALITGYDPRKNTDEAIAKKIEDERSLTKEQSELTRGALRPLYKTGHDPESGSRNPGRTKSLSNILTALEKLEKENRDNSAKLAAINFLTQPPPPPQRRPSSDPRQPLRASRSASLSNRTGEGGRPR